MNSSSSSAFSAHETSFEDFGIELPILTRVNKLRSVANNSPLSNYSIFSEDSNPDNDAKIVAAKYHQSLSEMAPISAFDPALPDLLHRSLSQKAGKRVDPSDPHAEERRQLEVDYLSMNMENATGSIYTGGDGLTRKQRERVRRIGRSSSADSYAKSQRRASQGLMNAGVASTVDGTIGRGKYGQNRHSLPLNAFPTVAESANQKDSVDEDDISLPEIEKIFEDNVRQSKASALNGDVPKFGGATLPATDDVQVQYNQRVSTIIDERVEAINKTIASLREELGLGSDSKNVVVGGGAGVTGVATEPIEEPAKEPATETKPVTITIAPRPASYVQDTTDADAVAKEEGKTSTFNKWFSFFEHVFWGTVTVLVVVAAIVGSILSMNGYGRQWPPAPTPLPEN